MQVSPHQQTHDKEARDEKAQPAQPSLTKPDAAHNIIMFAAVVSVACGLIPTAPAARPPLLARRTALSTGEQLEAAQMLAAFARRCGPCRMQEELPAEEAPATPAPPADYDEAEARGIALYQASTPRARRPTHPHPHPHAHTTLAPEVSHCCADSAGAAPAARRASTSARSACSSWPPPCRAPASTTAEPPTRA